MSSCLALAVRANLVSLPGGAQDYGMRSKCHGTLATADALNAGLSVDSASAHAIQLLRQIGGPPCQWPMSGGRTQELPRTDTADAVKA